MKILAINIILAVAWSALWNGFTVLNLISGFVVGYGALWFARDLIADAGERRYFRALPQTFVLIAYFIKELIKSSIMVARDCIAPRPNLHPAIVKMPLDAHSDFEIFLLSNMITLTPGTLTLDVAPDRSFLMVHSIYATDEDALVHDLKSGMERRIGEVFRS